MSTAVAGTAESTSRKTDATAMAARPEVAWRAALVVVAVKLALHVWVNLTTAYELHRDELLYLAMGEHLRLWRMDFPPLIAILANAARAIGGDHLLTIRMVPAIAGAALLLLDALVARELGGGRTAQVFTMVAVLFNLLFLRSANLFQPVVLDQLSWTAGLLALARIARLRAERASGTYVAADPVAPDESRWWIAFGVACGLGLLAKFSVLLFGFAAFVGILLTPLRRTLRTRWPWLAALLALAIGSPSLVGQLVLGFPLLDQMRDLQATQLARVSVGEFFAGQLLFSPGTLVAFAGAGVLLLAPWARPFRVIGFTCVVVELLLLALGGKPYYAGPLHPTLLAAGVVAIDQLQGVRARRALHWSMAAAVIAYGIVTLPLGVPILPPARMEQYVRDMRMTGATRTNRGTQGRLPQDYADMLGWEDQVRAVASAYHALPPDDRARVVIVGGNYGEAGAIDFYGPRYGLPKAVHPSGSYWFWGPGDKPGDVVLVMADEEATAEVRALFGSVERLTTVGHPYAVEEESRVHVLLCRQPRITLQELWPRFAGRN